MTTPSEHLAGTVDAHRMLRQRRQKLQHPSRTRAHIQKKTEGPLPRQPPHGRLHPFLGNVQGADPVPFLGHGSEIGRSALRPLVQHRLQALPVGGEHGIVRRQKSGDLLRQSPADTFVMGPEDHPAALLVPLQKAGLGHQLQMPGNTRLALLQDARQLGDVELALGKDGEQPQPRHLPGRTQSAEYLLHAASHGRHAYRRAPATCGPAFSKTSCHR